MTTKAYIYAEDGALLGYLAANTQPPEVLELDGRFFRHKGVSIEHLDDDTDIESFDYWEIDNEVVETIEVFEVCIICGRVRSQVWWKCCPDHIELDGPSVICQSCVEDLHPGDPEFERE
jgi:hypothetical protein